MLQTPSKSAKDMHVSLVEHCTLVKIAGECLCCAKLQNTEFSRISGIDSQRVRAYEDYLKRGAS